jgi:hypothetical protein
MDEKQLSEMDILTNFPLILDERCKLKRQRRNQPLAPYSLVLVGFIAQLHNSPYLTELVTEKIDYILEDCEVFHGMDENKAIDAMGELSNWAAVFVDNDKYSHIYVRICELIRLIRVSYPCKLNEWTEMPHGY